MNELLLVDDYGIQNLYSKAIANLPDRYCFVFKNKAYFRYSYRKYLLWKLYSSKKK